MRFKQIPVLVRRKKTGELPVRKEIVQPRPAYIADRADRYLELMPAPVYDGNGGGGYKTTKRR